MKRFILPILAVGLFIFNACSGDATTQNPANANSPNANVVVAQNGNGNQMPADNSGNTVVNMPVNRPLVNSPANAKVPAGVQLPGVTAPYNSTIKTTMTAQNQFVETREFKDDPQIKKVERLQQSKSIKIYLKNGKVVDLPYEKGAALFLAASPDDILIAAGVKAAPTPAPANPTKGEQKSNR